MYIQYQHRAKMLLVPDKKLLFYIVVEYKAKLAVVKTIGSEHVLPHHHKWIDDAFWQCEK